MMNAEPGVVQLGQSETQHGSGSPTFIKVPGISDFRKYSWRRQEVIVTFEQKKRLGDQLQRPLEMQHSEVKRLRFFGATASREGPSWLGPNGFCASGPHELRRIHYQALCVLLLTLSRIALHIWHLFLCSTSCSLLCTVQAPTIAIRSYNSYDSIGEKKKRSPTGEAHINSALVWSLLPLFGAFSASRFTTSALRSSLTGFSEST